jgi:hypothetical protein
MSLEEFGWFSRWVKLCERLKNMYFLREQSFVHLSIASII